MKELYKIKFQLDDQQQSRFPANERKDKFNKKVPRNEGAEEKFKYWGNVFKEKEAKQQKLIDIEEERIKQQEKAAEEKLALEQRLNIAPPADFNMASPRVDNKSLLKSSRSDAKSPEMNKIDPSDNHCSKNHIGPQQHLDTQNSIIDCGSTRPGDPERQMNDLKKVSFISYKKIAQFVQR